MSRIVTFRGLMADLEVETILLQTNNGLTGYKINKFQMMPETPGQTEFKFVMQIFKTEPTTAASANIDFSDNRLLAAAEVEDHNHSYYPHSGTAIVFDREIFNQDIYITLKDIITGGSCNYYLELEQMDLSLDEQTVATLKDIRNVQ